MTEIATFVPDITFTVYDVDGVTPLATSNSGPIPNANTVVWYESGFVFEATSSTVVVSLFDNVAEGTGVDFVIDDIFVAISLEDTDGDGILDSDDVDPNNPCAPNPYADPANQPATALTPTATETAP